MADPVSWLLIEPGWTVYDAAGKKVGKVKEVLADEQTDIFHGLTVADDESPRRAGRGDPGRRDPPHAKVCRGGARQPSIYAAIRSNDGAPTGRAERAAAPEQEHERRARTPSWSPAPPSRSAACSRS